MKAYDYQNGAHRLPLLALVARRLSPPLRHADDAVWPPRARAYGGESGGLLRRLERPWRIASRLTMPVLMLVVLLGAAWLYTDAFLVLPGWPSMVQRALLAVSDLILPAAWMLLQLTNRRYGAPYAFGQLVAALAVILVVALAAPDMGGVIASTPALGWRTMLAFGGSFFFANFIAIVTFDAFRGPRWWSAPLAASFVASFLFSAVYYPAAFAGAEQVAWAEGALVHFALFFGESIVLLAAYWLLRPAMRPLHGMNGY